jgi:translation initiation factor IF-1
MDSKQGKIIKEGTVIETLPNTVFKVKLDNEEGEIMAHLGGRMRLNYIRVLLGDRVRVEMTPYDTTKGRIIHRL